MKNVSQLRNEGYKVRVRHVRKFKGPNGVGAASKREIAESGLVLADCLVHNGGSTSVEITSPSNQTVSATAECSEKDAFNRKIGLNIALGRALAQLS